MNDTLILIISGDSSLAADLPLTDGFSVRRFSDTEGAICFAESAEITLAVVDNSLDALRALRGRFAFPIIAVCAGNSEAERIAALMLGADDVLLKPFGASELSAHIRSRLGGSARGGYPKPENVHEPKSEPSEIAVDELVINVQTHKCILGGKEIKLTPSEFNILWYLCVHRGRVVSGKELFETVWGEKYLDSADTLMPHIARLRRKLGEPAKAPRYIKTVWGVGYVVN